jgi:hypothetical protein
MTANLDVTLTPKSDSNIYTSSTCTAEIPVKVNFTDFSYNGTTNEQFTFNQNVSYLTEC